MDGKTCNSCKEYKPKTAFNRRVSSKDGLNYKCRDCVRRYKKEYRDKNIEKVRNTERAIRSRNKLKINAKQREAYYSDLEKQKNRRKRYRANNRGKIRERNKSYYHRVVKSSPEWKARKAVYRYVRRVLNHTGGRKRIRYEKVLGYGAEKLKLRLETNFSCGMCWENYGVEWHIDHTKPISVFIKEGETRPNVINMLCNLRPMWAKENMSKGGRWEGAK